MQILLALLLVFGGAKKDHNQAPSSKTCWNAMKGIFVKHPQSKPLKKEDFDNL